MASGRRVAKPQDLVYATLVALVSDARFTDLLGTTHISFDEAFYASVSDFRGVFLLSSFFHAHYARFRLMPSSKYALTQAAVDMSRRSGNGTFVSLTRLGMSWYLREGGL